MVNQDYEILLIAMLKMRFTPSPDCKALGLQAWTVFVRWPYVLGHSGWIWLSLQPICGRPGKRDAVCKVLRLQSLASAPNVAPPSSEYLPGRPYHLLNQLLPRLPASSHAQDPR
jgi:hypothetical protein